MGKKAAVLVKLVHSLPNLRSNQWKPNLKKQTQSPPPLITSSKMSLANLKLSKAILNAFLSEPKNSSQNHVTLRPRYAKLKVKSKRPKQLQSRMPRKKTNLKIKSPNSKTNSSCPTL